MIFNLVKDLNRDEVPHGLTALSHATGIVKQYTSFTGSKPINSDRTHCALSRKVEWEVVTDRPPVHRKKSCYCREQ